MTPTRTAPRTSATSSMFAYVGCRTTRERNARGKGISVFRIDRDGDARREASRDARSDGAPRIDFDSRSIAWEQIQLLAPLENPSFLTLNQAQTVLYAVHGDGSEVSSFAVDRITGRLTALNRVSCEGCNPVDLAISRSGEALLVANYATGSAVSLPVLSDGALGPVSRTIAFQGDAGPHRVEQTSSHPHHIARFTTHTFDTDWHIVPDKGLDTVFAIRFLEDGGEPVVTSQRVREGAGPRHAACHPTRSMFYVVNELDATLTAFTFEVSSGEMSPVHTLSLLPSRYHGSARAAGIVVAPHGEALYVSIRGLDTVATVHLEKKRGTPVSVQWTRAEGRGPRFICLNHANGMLYVANELSDSIIEFAVDTPSRMPVPTGYRIATASPVCIVFKDHQE